MWKTLTVGMQNFFYHHRLQVLIDCGTGRDAVKKLLQQCDGVETLILSHAHADHYGGAVHFLRRNPCRLLAPPLEQPFLLYPQLEPALLFGGGFPTPLGRKWLLGPPDLPVNDLDWKQFPEIEGVTLPGHTPALCGIRDGERMFVADALFGSEILEKYPLLYHFDPHMALETAKNLPEKASEFIPSHGSTGGRELVKKNVACIENAFTAVKEAVRGGKRSIEEILSSVMERIALPATLETYYLNRSALLGYVSTLERKGELKCILEGSQVVCYEKF